MEIENELPEIESKQIKGIEISNLEIAKIAMICDYLVVDRFHDISSFPRFEQCFGPLFPTENHDFIFDVFQVICGPKKKYISYGRLISSYLLWKSKTSNNTNFNKFMEIVFTKIIKINNEVVGVPVEGGRVFSTRNARGRKVISKFGVFSDENKNKLNGFYIQYDDVFESILATKKIEEGKNNDNIKLEMNFHPDGKDIKDRDGISHIGGNYSKTKNIIKFLIFKCRSGKTFYIGDNTCEENEILEPFLFGTSSCQLKSLRVELIEDQLMYIEPKFQPSYRVNTKILPLDLIDDKFITENIINPGFIFEENEIKELPLEQLIETNNLVIPCISDDAFIDKKSLFEPISGKNFNEVYKSFIVQQSEMMEVQKEELKKEIVLRTIQRKRLLKIYLNKIKNKENVSVLKYKEQPEDRINMDKFLTKIRGYRKKMDKKIAEKKEELKKQKEEMTQNDEEEEDDDEDDWIDNKNLKEEY